MIGDKIVVCYQLSRRETIESFPMRKKSMSIFFWWNLIRLGIKPLCYKLAVGSWLFVMTLGLTFNLPNAQASNHCKFDGPNLQFEGSSVEQAQCLLTPVKPFAHLGNPLSQLPSPLNQLLGKAVNIKVSTFRRYLDNIGVSEYDLGGSLDSPVSRARGGIKTAPMAHYFVLHDTSNPNLKTKSFPSNMNGSASFNDLTKVKSFAHVFINRKGESKTINDFRESSRATKLEKMVLGRKSKGLFLHVELVQPRRSDKRGRSGNDAQGPTPGFTDVQLDRLALVYISASIRRKEWLIPAYHAVLDKGLKGGHDDPQNFDLPLWSAWIDSHLDDIAVFKAR